MLEFNVTNENLNQADLIDYYNAFIDELVRICPAELLKKHGINTEKIFTDGVCAGDLEMCAFFHHFNGSLNEFADFRSFFTKVLNKRERRIKIAKAFKEDDELKIKVGNTTDTLGEYLHFVEMIGKFQQSCIHKKNIGAWMKKSDVLGWTWSTSALARRLKDLNIQENNYTVVNFGVHVNLIIKEKEKFYVFEDNNAKKPQPLDTIEQVAARLSKSIRFLYLTNIKYGVLVLSSLSFESSPDIDQYIVNMQEKYSNEPIISSLIAEFQAGWIDYETVKKTIDEKEGKPPQDLSNLIDLNSINSPQPQSDGFEAPGPLMQAAFHGNLPTVKWLIDQGVKINLTGSRAKERAALSFAAARGHLAVVQLLVEKGAEINHSDRKGITALFRAAQEGYWEVVEFLLDHNAEINLANNNGATPLYAAVQDGHIEVVRLLLERGAKIDRTTRKGVTVFFFALKKKHNDVVKFLLDTVLNESNPDQVKLIFKFIKEAQALNELGIADQLIIELYNKLCHAASVGDLKTVELIVESGFDINFVPSSGFQTPLHCAVWEGQFEVVQYLLKSKASMNAHINALIANDMINAAESSHYSLLSIAAAKPTPQHTKIVDLLLSPDLINPDSDAKERSPLHFAAGKGDLLMVQLLVARQAEVNYFDKEGITPLFRAARYGHTEVVKFLLENRAEIDHPRIDGVTPLFIASQYGHQEVVELLLGNNAEINCADKEEITPLYIAAQNGNVAVANLLLAGGAEVDHPHKDGATPLFIAAQNGHQKVVQLLLEQGAKIDFTYKNATPFYIALKKKHNEVVKLLLDKVLNESNPDQIKLILTFIKEAQELNQIEIADQLKIELYNKLCHAASVGDLKKVELIVKSGFDINFVPSQGFQTPLHCAVWEGWFEVVQYLLKNKASINAHINALIANKRINTEESSHHSLLFVAADQGHIKIVDLLLSSQYKSSFFGRGKEKQNELDVAFCRAKEKGSAQMAEKLLNAGAKINSAYSSKNKSEPTSLLSAPRSSTFFEQNQKSNQNTIGQSTNTIAIAQQIETNQNLL